MGLEVFLKDVNEVSRPSTELCFLTIRDANSLYMCRQLSPVELTQAHLERIDECDGRLKSYVTLLPERALSQARIAEAEIMKGHTRGPFHGIPFALKDLFDTKGITTEAHSKILEGRIPSKDATVVARLNEEGAILLGKQAMGEFAIGSLKTKLYDRPHNPWNLNYATGGSSSGSAAGVASGLCMGALGTDTGGSIRGPASYCGIVGLKPTYGRVSRSGVIPLSWSLDHCGPMTRTVEDAAFMLGCISGNDSDDPTSSNAPVPDYVAALQEGVKGLVIGVPRHFFNRPETKVDPEVLSAVEKALIELQSLGAHLKEIIVPSLEYFRIAHTIIMLTEGLAYHRENLRWHAENYADLTWNHLASGAFFTASDYVQAQRVRSRISREFEQVFQQVNAVALPTAPRTAWPISETDSVVPVDVHNFRAPFDMTGMPAITVPCGFSSAGLPIGLQIAGRPFDEATIFRVAYAYEKQTKWTKEHPSF